MEALGEKPKAPPSATPQSPSQPVIVDVKAWLKEEPSMTFSSWVERAKEEKRRLSSQTPEEQREEVLQAKYTRLWKARIHKCECKGGWPSATTWLMLLFGKVPE